MPRPEGPRGRTGAPVVQRPTWSSWREAIAVIGYRPHLAQTIRIALIVGTILFSINQLDVVLRHGATAGTYLKGALTYLVPFCVSNYGILIATRRPTQKE